MSDKLVLKKPLSPVLSFDDDLEAFLFTPAVAGLIDDIPGESFEDPSFGFLPPASVFEDASFGKNVPPVFEEPSFGFPPPAFEDPSFG